MTEVYRIMVTGSRTWEDYNSLMRQLALAFDRAKDKGYSDIIVDHGGAIGADSMVSEFINKEQDTLKNYGLNVNFKVHRPNYEKYGRYEAPHVRNREMVDLEPDELLVFRKGGPKSAGTTKTWQYAKSKGIMCYVMLVE